MGQSTDKNKLQQSLSTSFGTVRMRTTTIFERFQHWSSLRLRVTPEAMTDSKFLCYINKASQRIDNFKIIVLITVCPLASVSFLAMYIPQRLSWTPYTYGSGSALSVAIHRSGV